MTKYVKADCGFHYSEKGGACSKCTAHPAIAARNKIKYMHEDKRHSAYHCPKCEAELQSLTISDAIFEGVIADGVQFDCKCTKCNAKWTQLYMFDSLLPYAGVDADGSEEDYDPVLTWLDAQIEAQRLVKSAALMRKATGTIDVVQSNSISEVTK